MAELPIVLAELAACYPRQAFPDTTVTAYVNHLRDLDADAVERACDRIVHRSEWLPSVAEIRSEVAEEHLQLPTVEEAWEIASRGALKDAPPEVRAAAEAVGGRGSIIRSERPEQTARWFRDEYKARRARAVMEFSGATSLTPSQHRQRQLGTGEAYDLGIPATDKMKPRPVVLRWMHDQSGVALGQPTEDEQIDAIKFLRDGPLDPSNPLDDPLYCAAERIMAECNGETIPA